MYVIACDVCFLGKLVFSRVKNTVLFSNSNFSSLCISRKYPYSPTEGIRISWGVGGSERHKNLKKYEKLYWNFQRDVGSWKKSLPWGRYGYFLELNIANHKHSLNGSHRSMILLFSSDISV